MDMSEDGDRFVIASGYNETIDETKLEMFVDDKLEIITTNKRPIIDVIIVIDPKKGIPVDQIGVGGILTHILRSFPNIRSANSDRYQSAKLRQELIRKGVASQAYSFSRKQQMEIYTKKRAQVWNNNLAICSTEDYESHLIDDGGKKYSPSALWELEGKNLIKDGTKIDHPDNYSKDVQDVVAILVHDLLQLEVSEGAVMASSIDQLSDEKFMDLCTRYMDELHKMRKGGVPVDERLTKLADELRMNLKDVHKLAQFVAQEYDYDWKNKT